MDYPQNHETRDQETPPAATAAPYRRGLDPEIYSPEFIAEATEYYRRREEARAAEAAEDSGEDPSVIGLADAASPAPRTDGEVPGSGDDDTDGDDAAADQNNDADDDEPEPARRSPGSPHAPTGKLPVFVRPARRDQWTRQKMAGFLRELAASQSVTQAARSVGMGRQSAYRLRNRLQGTPFSLGWEMALESGLQQLAHAVMDRAVNGEEVPHYYHGELVATSRRYDNRLATWILANPWQVGRQQVAREYCSAHFDAVLHQIEFDAFDWPAQDDEGREREFMRESWYAADAEEAGTRRPGGRRR